MKNRTFYFLSATICILIILLTEYIRRYDFWFNKYSSEDLTLIEIQITKKIISK